MPDFLIVGCGSAGKRHLRNLLKLAAGDVLAFDPRADRREEVRAQFGVSVTDDLDSVYALGVRVLLVCSPPNLHVTQAQQAVDAGCHLFIEKPLSDSFEGVDRLIQTVAAKQLITLVGCNFRFHPGLQKAKKLLEEGAIGRVISARAQFGQYLPDWHPRENYRQGYSARRALGGGVVLDRIHEIDYMRWLLGEVTSVFGVNGHISHLEIETEDVAEIVLRFASGAVGSVHLDYIRRPDDCRCEIVGEEGTIEWCYQNHTLRWYCSAEKTWRTFEWPNYDSNTMYVDELRHFLACLEDKESPMCDVREGARVLAIALKARDSCLTGGLAI